MSQIQERRKIRKRFGKNIRAYRNNSKFSSFVKWYMDQNDMECLKNYEQILLKMEQKNCGQYMFDSFNELWEKCNLK